MGLRAFLLSFFLFGLAISFTGVASAQVGSTGVAFEVPFQDANVPDGSVVCANGDGFTACDSKFNPNMIGVIADDPSAFFEVSDFQNGRPIIVSGNSVVRVSASAGNISAGDFITSSDTPGVAIVAALDGYALGMALEDYAPADPNQEGLILATIDVHPTVGLSGPSVNLLQNLREGLAVPFISPLVSLRYLLAFVIVVIGFTFGFLYFGRVARSGVEAIGRNPLAYRTIQVSIFVNVLFGVSVVVGSIVVAGLILVL